MEGANEILRPSRTSSGFSTSHVNPPITTLVNELLGAVFFEETLDTNVMSQIANAIYSKDPIYKEISINLNWFSLDLGVRRYRERLADIRNQQILASVKASLEEVLERVEGCENAIKHGTSDKPDRKRYAEEAIDEHLIYMSRLSKRLKTDLVKGEGGNADAEHGESQELGTIIPERNSAE